MKSHALSKASELKSDSPDITNSMSLAFSTEPHPGEKFSKKDAKQENTVTDAFKNGKEAYQKNEFNMAIKFFKEVITVDRQNNDALFYLTSSYFQLSQWQNALNYIDQDLSPINPYYREILGIKVRSLANIGKYNESLLFYDSYISLNNNDELQLEKIMPLIYLGEYEEALQACELVIEENSNLLSPAWSIKGYIFDKLRLYQEALHCYDKASETYDKNQVNNLPFPLSVHVGLNRILRSDLVEQKVIDSAEECIDYQLNEGESCSAFLVKGLIAKYQKLDTASTYLEKADKMLSSNDYSIYYQVEYYITKSRVLSKFGFTQEAIKALMAAFEIQRDNKPLMYEMELLANYPINCVQSGFILPTSGRKFTICNEAPAENNIEIDLSKAQEEEALGSGSTGIVRKYVLEDKQAVAVKFLKLDGKSASEEEFAIHEFENEFKMMRSLNSPYIIKTLGYCKKPQQGIVMENVVNGNLFYILHGINKQKFGPKTSTRFVRQIAIALALLHSKNIVHCDVKSPNILVTDSYDAKLCDFDLSMSIDQAINHRDQIGTTGWMSPEVIDCNTGYTPKSDIYSLGVIAWEMITGNNPIDELIDTQNFSHIDVPIKYHIIMRACTRTNPIERPDAYQLINFIEAKGFFSSPTTYLATNNISAWQEKVLKLNQTNKKPKVEQESKNESKLSDKVGLFSSHGSKKQIHANSKNSIVEVVECDDQIIRFHY